MNKFVEPTVEELAKYAAEIGFRGFDAYHFLDHYQMIGWVTGKNRIPMKDWKAAVRLWRRNQQEWSGQEKPETDPAVLDYAKQARHIITELKGFEIGRFFDKVFKTIGPDGLRRVKAEIERGKGKTR